MCEKPQSAGIIINSSGVGDTHGIARVLAKALKGGDIVFLRGPIGAGKTEFVKAVCGALGAKNSPVSASFGLMKEYEGSKLKIFHIDLFRLEACEVFNLGFEEMFYEDNAVVFAEWPGPAETIFSADRLEIDIKLLKGDRRGFFFTAGGKRSQTLLKCLGDCYAARK